MEYLVAKWLHVLSSTLLFGTGLGSAYYMFFASRTRDPRAVAPWCASSCAPMGGSRRPPSSSSR